MKHVRSVAPILAAAAVLALPAAANAGPIPTRVSITSYAHYVSPLVINLGVRVLCEEGQSYRLTADVLQNGTWGFGQVGGECTGHTDTVVMEVEWRSDDPHGWQLGGAQAYLSFCASTCGEDARLIHIV
jgi:hypothetical protein